MKKAAIFPTLFLALFAILLSSLSVYGQEKVTTNDIRSDVNSIQNKANDANVLAEKILNATTIGEVNTSAKQILLILEDAKNIIKAEQTTLDAFSTPENKNKCGRYLNSIASDIVDLQNRIEWATHEVNKIMKANEWDEIKHSATEVMTEIKKVNTIVAETTSSLALTDQELSAKE